MSFKHLYADLKSKQTLYQQYGDQVSLLKVILSDGTCANVLFRLQASLAQLKLKPLALVPHLLNKWINGCVIGIGAQFDAGLVLIHPIGVVINSSVRGGRNVRIESSVVIGDNRGGSPVLGHDVFLGSGAKVIGPIRLGDGCRIGANAVVLKDVPDGATAVGVPAKVK